MARIAPFDATISDSAYANKAPLIEKLDYRRNIDRMAWQMHFKARPSREGFGVMTNTS